ncbi:putative Late embryogenesis abundant protein, LEA-25/LEA-D113 [Medicago truncatula]|uniref:Late embryogenesis abundant protein n=1 Tax=Medicago truncatula TaxID=3880 RepID=G7JGG4_MEDTR|nr:late embryogenesis abundant protein 6 [Medicago truncatula]AES90817.2 late embryogenesis abundant protein [Medicago truncatula]RHN63105.1 putative Late embryogenesis abundant protein, LEA-25/LEA-D113 [Medicago truncatula]
MQSSMEKLKNKASAAKEQADIYKAKIDEKAEKRMARTKEEKVIAHERAKAKEHKAKMELHEAKARHAAEKLHTKKPHYYGHHGPVEGVQQPQPQVVGTKNEPVGVHQPEAVVGNQYQENEPVRVPQPQPQVVETNQYQGNQPLGSIPKPGTVAPTYPLGGGNLPQNNRM